MDGPLEKMETHMKLEHPNRVIILDSDNPGSKDNAGYKTMTRDQVIDMITLNANLSNKGGFICYFCEDVVGNIEDIKNHFTVEHDASEAFKVKRVKVIFMRKFKNGILLPKLFLPTVRKNCSTNREKLLEFEAEGREFAKILRSPEQFIQTVKVQNNFW